MPSLKIRTYTAQMECVETLTDLKTMLLCKNAEKWLTKSIFFRQINFAFNTIHKYNA